VSWKLIPFMTNAMFGKVGTDAQGILHKSELASIAAPGILLYKALPIAVDTMIKVVPAKKNKPVIIVFLRNNFDYEPLFFTCIDDA
jgi:hypothetical protein